MKGFAAQKFFNFDDVYRHIHTETIYLFMCFYLFVVVIVWVFDVISKKPLPNLRSQ